MKISKDEALKAMFEGKVVRHESGVLLRLNYGTATSQVITTDEYNKLPDGEYEIIEGGKHQ
jgi:hypothetical protein